VLANGLVPARVFCSRKFKSCCRACNQEPMVVSSNVMPSRRSPRNFILWTISLASLIYLRGNLHTSLGSHQCTSCNFAAMDETSLKGRSREKVYLDSLSLNSAMEDAISINATDTEEPWRNPILLKTPIKPLISFWVFLAIFQCAWCHHHYLGGLGGMGGRDV
jgi:hypothetical protein